MSTITVSLREILKHNPCGMSTEEPDKGFNLLRKNTKAKLDDPITLKQILYSNGIEDAIWCLRVLPEEHAGIIRHFAVDCAEHVKRLMQDQRSLKALEVARRYAEGNASVEELLAAEAAAWEAAAREGAAGAAGVAGAAERAAAGAARAAADAAARAAGAAAEAAARAAIWAAEWSAAGEVAGEVTGEVARAAGAAEREYQTERFLHWFCAA